jgi:hypothetical protein
MDQNHRITLFTGTYGSGKSEIAVSYSHHLLDLGYTVKVLDLDVVNPYFRCREAAAELEKRGATVVAPKGAQFFADLPIILPEIRASFRDDRMAVVGDVGGDDVGARVLGSLADVVDPAATLLLFVINGKRPFTGTAEGCLKILNEIQDASRLAVGGLVSNTHLMDETTPELIHRGYELTCEVSRRTGIPVRLVTVETRLVGLVNADLYDCPLLPLRRSLLPPWGGPLKTDLTSLPV